MCIIEKIGETLYSVSSESDEWTIQMGWRYMFGSEAFVAGAFSLLCFFIPMSPRFLAMKGRNRQALKVLARINGRGKGVEILNDIRQSDSVKSTRLFSFGVLVIFIGVMLSVFQQAVGINAVLYYAPRIYQSMGMENPMVQTVVMGIVNITFTLVAVFTVERLGRKPLLIWGSIGMAAGALDVATVYIAESLPPMVVVISIMVYSASFMFS